MTKKYALYLIRWQLSTPILAGVIFLLTGYLNAIWITVIANLIGGLIFFWVDRFIFRSLSSNPLWEIMDDVVCFDCGASGRGYRIAEWLGYDKKQDKHPQYRCEKCKDVKLLDVEKKIHHHH